MLRPEIPANEGDRVAALHSYELLDTPAEPAFDEVTQLVTTILDVPISCISLIDGGRQWFKSHRGIAIRETPRDLSFCAHVVASGETLVVPDAHADERFADNPFVTSAPNVRFYAAVPLRTPDGFVLGTLFAVDTHTRSITPEQLGVLTLLARQVMWQLEARRARLDLSRQRRVFDAMAEGVVVHSETGAITSWNVAAAKTLGLTPDQMRGLAAPDPRWRAIWEDGAPVGPQGHPAQVALRTGIEQRNVVMGVQLPSSPEGVIRWLIVNAIPRKTSSGDVSEVIVTFQDITALRTATLRMTQQERLVMAGTLAGGVGHEINNPLAYVIGNLDFSLSELDESAGQPVPVDRAREMREVLGEAREGAERIRKIVRNLHSLAREDVALTLAAVKIDKAVETALSMTAHEMRHIATVVISPTVHAAPYALADESRLTKVLVSLLLNAAQAFTDSDPSANRIEITAERRGDRHQVAIRVADNGPGVPIALRRRIFDPFFTTRPVGHGNGLGLSMSRNIIDSLNGELLLESDEHATKGATFAILLPATDEVAAPKSSPMASESFDATTPAKGARGKIAVIDDEVTLLNTIKRILQREHDVQLFSDPREALKAIEEAGGDDLDLILCDLTMPHLSGAELFRHVQSHKPHLANRFVFVTGGAINPAAELFLASAPHERIEKPFAAEKILGIARRFTQARRASVSSH